jgi:hypothetical protein
MTTTETKTPLTSHERIAIMAFVITAAVLGFTTTRIAVGDWTPDYEKEQALDLARPGLDEHGQVGPTAIDLPPNLACDLAYAIGEENWGGPLCEKIGAAVDDVIKAYIASKRRA